MICIIRIVSNSLMKMENLPGVRIMGLLVIISVLMMRREGKWKTIIIYMENFTIKTCIYIINGVISLKILLLKPMGNYTTEPSTLMMMTGKSWIIIITWALKKE